MRNGSTSSTASPTRRCDLPALGRFRVNLHRERGQAAAAIRVLPPRVPKLCELALPPESRGPLDADPRTGAVGGATGAGKTTTLAALVDEINRRDATAHHHGRGSDRVRTSFTIEPRRAGGDRRGRPDFPAALRAAVRQAPDVLVIGEMRDHESMRIALSAAETGHLVFSSLHTTDIASTIARICDSFPNERQNTIRQELSLALTAVMTQTLVPQDRRRPRSRRRTADGRLRRAAAHSQERAAASPPGDVAHAPAGLVDARGFARTTSEGRSDHARGGGCARGTS